MTWQDWLSVFSTVVGVVGLLFGYYQWNRSQAIERRRREQQWVSLDRARYVIWDHNQIEAFTKKYDDQDLSRALWLNHQAASDLYISLVDQYLSEERSFTYDDLDRLCRNGFIYWQWQEKQWRLLICRRPENIGKSVPNFFTKEDRNPRVNGGDDQAVLLVKTD